MWYLQGTGRLKLLALLTAGSRLVALVGLILTVRSVDQLELAVLWQFLPYLLSAVVCWILLARDNDVVLRLAGPSAAGSALKDSVPLFVSLISGQLIVNSSVILLGQLAGYRQVGLFGPADRLASAIHGVLVAVEQAMMPHVSSAHETPGQPNNRKLILGGLVGCYAGACLLVGPHAPVVIPWYLGEGFDEAVPVVQLMGLATIISGVTRTFTLDLVSAGRSKTCSLVTAIGAGWHLVTAAFGAWVWGAEGVAVAVCGTQLFMGLALGIAIVRGRRRRPRTAAAAPLDTAREEYGDLRVRHAGAATTHRPDPDHHPRRHRRRGRDRHHLAEDLHLDTPQILLGWTSRGRPSTRRPANLYLKDRAMTYAAAGHRRRGHRSGRRPRPGSVRRCCASRIVVAIVPETVVLQVSVTGSTPEEAVAAHPGRQRALPDPGVVAERADRRARRSCRPSSPARSWPPCPTSCTATCCSASPLSRAW